MKGLMHHIMLRRLGQCHSPAVSLHASQLQQGGVPRKLTPIREGLREELSEDGAYTLVLEFSSAMELDTWNKFQPKIQSFFGPGEPVMTANEHCGHDATMKSPGGKDDVSAFRFNARVCWSLVAHAV